MKTSWGGVADWYDKTVSDDDSFQGKVVLPNISRLIDPKKGIEILDLACGQGFFSHALSAKGAKVVGVDISPELIAIAKKHASHNEEFYVSPAQNLSFLKPLSFDATLVVLALQNIEHIAPVFKEVSRVLKKGGKFVIVLNHPAFRISDKSSWGFDEEKKIQYRRVDEYLSESRKKVDMKPGTPGKEFTVSFHRPLQVYSKTLANAGFATLRIEEWVSHRESEQGPKKNAEDKARKEIPLFMCLECVKL
jgi:ubiquinone/menaquinone biosynthesis C-methylase UbiE